MSWQRRSVPGRVAPGLRFESFIRPHLPGLMRTASLLTGNHHDAQDAVQTCLVKAFVAWRKIERADSPDAYLRRILINVIRDGQSRKSRTDVSLALLPDLAPTSDPYPGVDDRDRLRQALSALPPRQRAVIVLRFYEDMTEHATAHVLRISPGTVKSQTSKALARLRQLDLFTEGHTHARD